jgi:hypothetical protein
MEAPLQQPNFANAVSQGASEPAARSQDIFPPVVDFRKMARRKGGGRKPAAPGLVGR